jgi:methanethiol S-methyltransferase
MALVLIMLGVLLQWPTLLTILMVPVLVYMYIRLARRGQQVMHPEFGRAYERYAASTPGFIPKIRALLGRWTSG